MKAHKEYFSPFSRWMLKMVFVILMALVFLAALYCRDMDRAYTEAVPSPDMAALVDIDGDFEFSDFPMDIRVAECFRVNLLKYDKDGAWADLTMPKVPPSIQYVLLFDGWHLLHASWEYIGETTLRLFFRTDKLIKLDGTIGLYLVILSE